MSLIGLIVALAVVGVVLWLVNSKVPMDPGIKTIINIVVLIVVVLFVLQAFGILGSLQTIQVPRIR